MAVPQNLPPKQLGVPPEHFGNFVFNRENENVGDKDFRVWLEKTKEDLGKYFMVASNRENVDKDTLDEFVHRTIVRMSDHSKHRDGVWNTVQQDGISIMNILLRHKGDLLLQVLKGYKCLLLGNYFEVLCNNLQTPQTTKRANIDTLRATYNALVDLCKDPGVRDELRSYIEHQRGSGDSVSTILRSILRGRDEEAKHAEKLLKALNLLDRSRALNKASKLQHTILAYQRVIENEKALLEDETVIENEEASHEEEIRESKRQKVEERIEGLQSSLDDVKKQHDFWSETAKN